MQQQRCSQSSCHLGQGQLLYTSSKICEPRWVGQVWAALDCNQQQDYSIVIAQCYDNPCLLLHRNNKAGAMLQQSGC
jgi:hypothetical protein